MLEFFNSLVAFSFVVVVATVVGLVVVAVVFVATGERYVFILNKKAAPAGVMGGWFR